MRGSIFMENISAPYTFSDFTFIERKQIIKQKTILEVHIF